MSNILTNNSHSETRLSDTLPLLSSHLWRTPQQVISCSMASPWADEESAFLHNKNNRKMRKADTTASVDLYEVVTNRIIERLESGELSWRKTWSSYGLARNYQSKKIYKGINMLIMNFFVSHEIPYYLSFKQAQELGGNVKKGAKSERVYYFNVTFKNENDQKITPEEANRLHLAGQKVKVIRFLKYYSVFNVADIEGIDFKFEEMKLSPNEKIERCDGIINNYPNAPQYVEKDKGRAYYDPTEDYINMPPIEQFESAEAYYATLFHEAIHSTGHAKRLAREEVVTPNKFGSIPYSHEELVAELGASFLCAITQIDREPIVENAAAYIQGWLKKLKDDKQFVFKAAAEAQKAVDYIIGSAFDEAGEE